MPQPPKQKPQDESPEINSTVADDQRDRGYYYDDSHGYEEYDPDDESDEGDD
ncbi:MAG: hypothetical protein JO053_00620 [Acidobacteria bacterium]|nr:hypothetical protein [Acidobacteriota bacterium]